MAFRVPTIRVLTQFQALWGQENAEGLFEEFTQTAKEVSAAWEEDTRNCQASTGGVFLRYVDRSLQVTEVSDRCTTSIT